MVTGDEEQVLSAARDLVHAFGHHRRDEYFSSFMPDATFIFHTTPDVLASRAAYEAEWDRWERDDGFKVLGCTSSDQAVQIAGTVAVFTHRVLTRSHSQGVDVTSDERETIVFRRNDDGRWLAIHEHLSATP